METTNYLVSIETIKANILADADFKKGIKKLSYYDVDLFIKDAKAYISAISEGRMINSIGSVSKSGMSRTIKFLSCENSDNRYWYRQYICLFTCLGYTEKKGSGYFAVNGCGMDMIFHTNYNICHSLMRFGIISKEECSQLSQQTPTTI